MKKFFVASVAGLALFAAAGGMSIAQKAPPRDPKCASVLKALASAKDHAGIIAVFVAAGSTKAEAETEAAKYKGDVAAAKKAIAADIAEECK